MRIPWKARFGVDRFNSYDGFPGSLWRIKFGVLMIAVHCNYVSLSHRLETGLSVAWIPRYVQQGGLCRIILSLVTRRPIYQKLKVH